MILNLNTDVVMKTFLTNEISLMSEWPCWSGSFRSLMRHFLLDPLRGIFDGHNLTVPILVSHV